jgi:pimeloyl-ACP methyl ester carboxylesterase
MAMLQQHNGSCLSYRKSGSGDPVLLLHASGCTGGSWQGLVSEFGTKFTFYTPDLAGCGRSSRDYIGEDAGLREEAEFIAPLLSQIDEPVHLVGHSFGGVVALAAALAWPERIKTLTLYEPVAFYLLRDGGGADRKKFELFRRVTEDMKWFIGNSANERAAAIFVDFWSGPGTWDRLPAAQQEDLSQAVLKMPAFRVIADERWNAEDFHRLHFPVAILRGDRSPPASLRIAEILADLIPAARLITIPGLGHMAPVTHPRAVAPVIADCLSQRGAGETSPQLAAAE